MIDALRCRRESDDHGGCKLIVLILRVTKSSGMVNRKFPCVQDKICVEPNILFNEEKFLSFIVGITGAAVVR